MGLAFAGCAGWTLPRDAQSEFDGAGSHLQRYASRLDAVEINSSFYRPHSRATYERWAAAAPPRFRFSVKLPRTVTHDRLLVDCEQLLDEFLAQVSGLGDRLGCLLVQLPPRLAFNPATATVFLDALRQRHRGAVAMEPRHASWFTPDVDDCLARRRIARVLADPVRHPPGAYPGGWQHFVYLRLHGSPRMYYSAYEDHVLQALGQRIARAQRESRDVWCIFDNTAGGDAAIRNALGLRDAIARHSREVTLP